MIALASRWVALVGAGLLLSVGALAETGASSKSASGPISAEARLEAIRAELIEAATKARTRVRSVAWIDANGSLQEAARFTSDVQVRGVRGVRVNNYLAPQVDMGPDLEALPTPSAEACAEDMGNHRRHALFRVLPGVPGPFLSNAQIAQFSQSFGQELVSLLAAETGWSLTVAKSSSYEGQTMSRYEEALIRRIQDEAPHVVTVQLQDLGPLPPLDRGVFTESLTVIGLSQPPLGQGLLGLTVVLSDRATGQSVFARQVRLALTRKPKGYLDAPEVQLAEPHIAKTALEGLQRDFRQHMACDKPEYPVIERQPNGELVINGGARVGLRAGEQLLLMRSGQLPKRILETGVAAGLALAEVVSVVEDRAVVKVIAGPRPASLEQLVVSPL
ncbi:MAG: hypothetical protein ACO3JE_07330 [Burkholderiaceae bacterium]